MAEPVLLLHGLGRRARSMRPLAGWLEAAGYRAHAADYPSTCHPIRTLVDEHLRPEVERFHRSGPLHVVTHSLGGILVRAYAERYGLPDGSRVVMLAPPNAGSAVADAVRGLLPFQMWCGPALEELGTGADSVPLQLGTADFEVGVIAGDRRVYPFFDRLHGSAHDGLVSVDCARLDGMDDFTVVRSGHALIMRNRAVARETLHFLRHGRFRNGEGG